MRFHPLTLTLSLVAASTTVAHAEAATPDLVAPPAVVRADLARELARRGRREKIAGGTLIGVASALLVTSIALNVADAVGGPVDHHCDDYFSPVCGDGSGRGPLWPGSMAAFAVGVPLLGAGIATYVVGGYHVNKSRRLQLVGAGASPLPGGAQLAASFRF